MKKLTAVLIASLLLSTGAYAAKASDGPGDPTPACAGLKFASGPSGKGYSKVFTDIQKACSNEVKLCEVTTTGGLDNLNSLSTKEADVGLAQVDTWNTMKNGDDNIANLQAVAGMHNNFLHVIVAAEGFDVKGKEKWMGLRDGDVTRVTIQRFSDLRGKRVALVGSAQLLGRQLEKALGYGMQVVDVETDAAAFDMVKKGTVAAAFSVSGWPSGSIKNLKQNSGLTLVPFDASMAVNAYSVRPINYKGLGVYNNNALGVANVLFTRAFKGEKATEVAKLKQCLTSNLLDLQEGDFEPAWNEIKNLDNTYDVPRFNASAASAPIKKK